MSGAPPPYTTQPQPYGNAGYIPQGQNPYPPQGPYPQGYYNPNQPQVIYVQQPAPQPQRQSDDNCWLTSILALCCGCLIGEVCCDSPMLCCVIPCPIRLPRFR
ncbi:hypothetical protein CAEBREN_05106 [Caenorhabditis brenneri]|uniref:Cysteine-rich transmembrane CYSTM domain-containing protein n=1 Tax=Caenorhabditis brenneri TaxID=135651 RepID=G0NRX2_CAEBE|nr:hypothetical protein CAEBREN_09178 [Caenorhabditis brenneri]EGT36396.1 hypothetical protein CAEBREN_05106 [Caenorhabditis brenneri]